MGKNLRSSTRKESIPGALLNVLLLNRRRRYLGSQFADLKFRAKHIPLLWALCSWGLGIEAYAIIQASF